MNPGDEVQVYRPGHPLHGKIGTLEFVGDAGIAYLILDHQSYPIHPADLQPVQEPS